VGKFEPYSRRELRRRRTTWVRDNAAKVAVVLSCFALMLAIATAVVIATVPSPPRGYLLGALHVGLVSAAFHILHMAFLAHDREAIWHVRGAWGEDNTRDELLRAKRRRLIWGWVDSINLQAGDLDHVVVTRGGGLVAIDTKWRSQVTSGDSVEMARAALKTKSRAEGLARTLLRSEQGARHRARIQPLTVTPVVVLWGAAQRTVPDGAEIEGVRFLTGRQLRSWLRQLDGDAVTKDAAQDALERLKRYRVGTWQNA
jgi:hypothetical protein